MHPTSFASPYGIGDLGPEAYSFIDSLEAAGCKLWQVLPLGPTGYGDSPYQCFSAFAGNPYLISPQLLLQDGLLTIEDLSDMPDWDENRVDFGKIFLWKPALLKRSFGHFNELENSSPIKSSFNAFCRENQAWLDEYSLFMTIKGLNGGSAWTEWAELYRFRDVTTLSKVEAEQQETVLEIKYSQFLFFKQWTEIKQYANQKGVQVIGDIPIFVAMDSADTWGNPDLFHLDKNGFPTVVAGVPPDYFSETGQLWGNPLYKWEIHEKTGYYWWINRIRASLSIYDIVRIDHFRGFAGYWEIPFGEPTAINGQWVKGPGSKLFEAIRAALGDLPIIAEDLGEITPDVFELRDLFRLPGMKILQFGFSGPDNPFLPHLYPQNCVVYTGSHDNDTVVGWYKTAPEHEVNFFHQYYNSSNPDVSDVMVRSIWSSVALFAIAPLQDLLGLDTDARMNFPGKVGGYWAWRTTPDSFSDDLIQRLRTYNHLYLR
jgi:4-alpha-glucanotransferase